MILISSTSIAAKLSLESLRTPLVALFFLGDGLAVRWICRESNVEDGLLTDKSERNGSEIGLVVSFLVVVPFVLGGIVLVV